MNDIRDQIDKDAWRREFRHRRRFDRGNGHRWVGAFIIIVGIAALLKAMILPIPGWIFSWPMILIAVGVFIGLRHNFRHPTWFILVVLGGIFLMQNNFPDFVERRYVWPLGLILLGIFFFFRPKSRWQRDCGPGFPPNNSNIPGGTPGAPGETADNFSSAELIDSTSIFGGIKKNVLSKNFKGGDVVNILGGSEINLSQADIQGTAKLEVTQFFGGTKIIIPADWEVHPEMTAIFGSVEDKRNMINPPSGNKVLIIEGTSIFGGIEIKSY